MACYVSNDRSDTASPTLADALHKSSFIQHNVFISDIFQLTFPQFPIHWRPTVGKLINIFNKMYIKMVAHSLS